MVHVRARALALARAEAPAPDVAAQALAGRALASDAQEPHPAGELLSARPARGSDRSLRRPLQSPALPREHRQSDAGRRLLRTRSNHPAGKRKDKTQNHPTPTLASQNSRSLKSNRMRQNLP